MTTDHFQLTIGVAPDCVTTKRGVRYVDQAMIGEHWQELAAEEYARSEIQVPAVVFDGCEVDRIAAGRPKGGDVVAVISGTRNSHFVVCSHQEWRQAVIRIAVALRERLGQATCQVAFWEVEFTYIK